MYNRAQPTLRGAMHNDRHRSTQDGEETMKYASIIDTIGKTPVVRLGNIAPAHVTLYAKIESFNPMGSKLYRLLVFQWLPPVQ